MLSSKYTHFLISETWKYYLIWKRVNFKLYDKIKLEILRGEAYLGIFR